MSNKKYIVLDKNIRGEFTFEEVLKFYKKTIYFYCYKFKRNNIYSMLFEIDDLYQEFSIIVYQVFVMYSVEKYNDLSFYHLLIKGFKWRFCGLVYQNNSKKNKYINNYTIDIDKFLSIKNIDSIENIYNHNVIINYVNKLQGINRKILIYKFLGFSYPELTKVTGKSKSALNSNIRRRNANVKKLLI